MKLNVRQNISLILFYFIKAAIIYLKALKKIYKTLLKIFLNRKKTCVKYACVKTYKKFLLMI